MAATSLNLERKNANKRVGKSIIVIIIINTVCKREQAANMKALSVNIHYWSMFALWHKACLAFQYLLMTLL